MTDQNTQNQTPISPIPAPQGTNPLGGNLPFQQTQAQQVTYTAGGPESAPVPIKVESSGAQNIEGQKNIENRPNELQAIERKEQGSVYVHNQQNIQVPVIQPPINVQPKQAGPKFFGYTVAPQIINNYTSISAQKGKGDPAQSRTWVYMLLDRILKKQAYIRK